MNPCDIHTECMLSPNLLISGKRLAYTIAVRTKSTFLLTVKPPFKSLKIMQTLRFRPSSKPRKQTFPLPFYWLATCLFSATLLFTGCADDGFKDSANENGEFADNNSAGAPSFAPQTNQAETALANRQLGHAQQIYADWLQENPTSGQAAAGLAITELLLILNSEPVTKLLIENLAARRAIDSSDMVYGSDGMLYWLSRGVSWEDQGQYQGILSLIGDKLPWTRQQLESITKFVEKLDQPINLLIPNLISIADHLHIIEKGLQLAQNDPAFYKIYIPGELFHDDRLSLTLGKSELALIQSALAATRAAIHFSSAYQHEWTLKQAFGAWRSNPDPLGNDPLFIPAFGPDDYSVRYLDQHLLREVARPEKLSHARLALADSLKHARNSIQLGLKNEKNFVLQWNDVDPNYLNQVIQLLNALESALFQSTDLPFTEPPTRADFSPFFTAQKHLAPSIPWMLRVDQNDAPLSDDSTAEGNWILNSEAKKAFFIDDIFTPHPKNDQFFPTIDLDSIFETLIDVVLNTYIEHIEDAYLLAR